MTLKLVADGGSVPAFEAAAWVVRLDRGELDEMEDDAFEAWLDELGHPEAYSDAAAALGILDDYDPDLPELAALRIAAIADALTAMPAEPKRRSRRWTPWAGGALAASVAAALFFGGYVAPVGRDRDSPSSLAEASAPHALSAGATVAYRTAVGEQRTVTLDDGSSVTLNTASEIAVDYTPGVRMVHLVRGQALFDVAHAKDRPFVVAVDGRRVTAMGTMFEIRFDLGRLEVTLLQGKVRVDKDRTAAAAPSPLAVLAPGQQFVAAAGLAPLVETIDVEKQLLWRRSLVELDDETIGSAVAELNRYSQTRIVVTDRHVAAMRMSGIVRTGDAAGFTALVEAMLPVASRRSADGDIELYHRP